MALALAYFTHTLDRANLGNAKTGTFEKDLHLVGNQFNLLLVLFYVPYGLFNIPWSILAKRFNSKVIIPITVAIWGTCTLASVATTNFGGIMACRIIMGAAEAAYKPCEVYYLTLFYTRKEMALRVSWIGQMGFIAGAVSGLISWGVFQWKGSLKVCIPKASEEVYESIANMSLSGQGWQYLFIIEGAITIGVAVFLYAFAPRSPDKSSWYTDQERRLARARLEEDSHDQDKQFHWEDARNQLKQWQTWAYAFLALMYGVGVASSSNFLPVSCLVL